MIVPLPADHPLALVRMQIDISRQKAYGYDRHGWVGAWPVSTAARGIDCRSGSGGTPCGGHRVRAWIGAGHKPGSVFVGRRFTGEIYSSALAAQFPQRDWILTRILWLCGEEPGMNRGGQVDSQRRFIYIHGTPDSEPIGVPGSHGCIRMRNADIMALFARITRSTRIDIVEELVADEH